MKIGLKRATGLLIVLLVLVGGPVFAWEKEEHRLLADSVFTTVMRECALQTDEQTYRFGGTDRAVEIALTAWDGATFAERVAFYAEDDFAGNRFHKRGRSIKEQLRSANLASLKPSSEPRPDNVVAAYLTEHIRALRIAAETGPSDTDLGNTLVRALEREADAQGFLADAFSAGHVLSYREGLLTFLARRNRIEAHDYHRDRGVFVINGRGDVWQTFGDGLLHWYPPTYEHVFEACATSLRELLVVWYVSAGQELPDSLNSWLGTVEPNKTARDAVDLWLSDHSGPEYYTDVRLQSLMLIPMPVAASWSLRTTERDEHGVRLRRHYPQLREPGFHDPDLSDIDIKYLYSRESVPDWMVPEPLRTPSATGAHELISSNPDWASVRWIQTRTAPPSYKGLLIQLGGQATIRKGQSRTGGSIGIGYGLWDDLMFIKNVSAAVAFMPSFHEPNDRLLTGSFGLGFDLPGESWPKALRLEGGVAIGLGEEFDDFGPLFAIGLDSPVMPLGFTYAGITWRIKYQWFSLDTPVSGPAIEMLLQ